jgi:hypothetical protein
VAVVVALTVIAVGPLARSSGSESDGDERGAPALATVERGRLASQESETGTLGYAARPDGSPYSVVNQASGPFTALPSVGDVIRCGGPPYRVADEPVVLLCGRTPAYRPLTDGLDGPDARQLERNLDDLGHDGIEELQEALGVEETGTLALGSVVFAPGPLRMAEVAATTGAPARPGAPLGRATSTRRRVEVELGASQAAAVEAGDRAQVTLPDNRTTPGVVTAVGSVAGGASEEDDQASAGAGAPSATIPVSIRLRRPRDVRELEQAPVGVQITTDGVRDALSVPVTALLALARGGYAVEVVGPGGSRELVPVELGLFDQAAGVVQVSGEALTAGREVVVPAT